MSDHILRRFIGASLVQTIEIEELALTCQNFSDAATYQVAENSLGKDHWITRGIALIMAKEMLLPSTKFYYAVKASTARQQRQKRSDEHDPFFDSFEWRRVRMMVLERDGARCACCGRTAADGVRINVDHIKNRKSYPELALDLSNLQVLCHECNHGKGNKYSTDWRSRHDHRV